MTTQTGTWAIVELFGHTRLAGWVESDDRFGVPMVRVDVPEVAADSRPAVEAHTAFFGAGAIYAIRPVDEALARATARRDRAIPITPFQITTAELQAMLLERTGARTLAVDTDTEIHSDSDDDDWEDEHEDGLD